MAIRIVVANGVVASGVDHVPMEQLQAAIAAWAKHDPGVQGLAVTGSRARNQRPADAWSDLDLLLVVDNPARYLDDGRWLNDIGVGEPVLTFLEPTAVGDLIERRALFPGGRDVDFAVLPGEIVRDLSAERLTAFGGLARRGITVVVDKSGDLGAAVERARALEVAPAPLPNEQEYRQVVEDLLYHLLWSAKKLRRGEMWVAWQSHQHNLGRLLTQLLEWEAWSQPGTRPDTWHAGRFVEQWGGRASLAALPELCGSYGRDPLLDALNATLTFTHRLGHELADRWGHRYPTAGHREVAAFLSDIT